MGKALYRKYRSKKLSEIIGQEHITTALSNALKKDRVGHAYLFTGPRGVGKTSIARILAHEVNQLPYDEKATHLDIIEIDAASNRRIDEIRALRERVHNAPTSAKYKVYIIDEVHMLTKEAFNALLKTLEEPPAHVIFILATTEVHKLPDTIISRTQRFTFKPAELSQTAAHLKTIAQSEKIDISDEALEIIARHGRGSFRDSISLLDQVSNSDTHIDETEVLQRLGIAPEESLQQLVGCIAENNPASLISQLHKLLEQGYQAPQIAVQLSKILRQQMIEGTLAIEPQTAVDLIKHLINIPSSPDPLSMLEVVLLEPILSRGSTPVKKLHDARQQQADATEASNNEPPAAKASQKASSATQQAAPKPKNEPQNPQKPKVDNKLSDEKRAKTTIPETNSKPLDESTWQQILTELKKDYNTLYGVARMASPRFENDKIILSLGFAFHQKRLSEKKNTLILSELIQNVTGSTYQIECIVDKDSQPPEQAPSSASQAASSEPIDTISNIFGGGEIL